MKEYTVGQYLADRLAEIGIGHLFAIPGDYCAEWIQNYIEPSSIQRVGSTNELNAGYAADGYARQHGVGAVCVTYSVGAFSLLNAVAGSYTERVPVVVINGAPSTAKHLEFRQGRTQWHHQIASQDTDLRVFEQVTAAAEVVSNPALAPDQIDNALRTCLTERKPVYLEMREDVYDLPCAPPQGAVTAAVRRSDPAGLYAALSTIGERLRAAERPLVWAGLELERFELAKPFAQLLDHLGIPYVTSQAGKAVLPEDNPFFVGDFDGNTSPQAVQDVFADADYILALGVWLTDENLQDYAMPYDHMSLVAHDVVWTRSQLASQVTLGDVIDGLLATPGMGPFKVPSLPEPPKISLPPEAQITYQGFYDTMVGQVGPDDLVLGGTGFNVIASQDLKIVRPHGFVSQSVYADIGYVTPAAIGAQLGAGEGVRPLVFAGDGGFQMTAQCISTMAELGLDPIIFVLNNGVYGIEQWLADPSVYGDDQPFYPLSVLHDWEYAKLPDVFGGKGWKVTTYGELEAAFGEARAYRDGPSLIQVCVPSKSIPELAEWRVPENQE